MSKYVETEWTLNVLGSEVTATRSECTDMTVYSFDSANDKSGLRGFVFTDKQLPALHALLAAMQAGPGTRVVRCRYCDKKLFFSTCNVDGTEVPDDYDGPWVDENGTSRCEESLKPNKAWPQAHYSSGSDICIIKGCERPRTDLVTCKQHEKLEN